MLRPFLGVVATLGVALCGSMAMSAPDAAEPTLQHVCERPLHVEGAFHRSRRSAIASANHRWSLNAARLHGERYVSLRHARDSAVTCRNAFARGRGGRGLVCMRRARPCAPAHCGPAVSMVAGSLFRQSSAVNRAIASWNRKVSRLDGGRYGGWARAADPKLHCQRSRDGLHVCAAVAKPCV